MDQRVQGEIEIDQDFSLKISDQATEQTGILIVAPICGLTRLIRLRSASMRQTTATLDRRNTIRILIRRCLAMVVNRRNDPAKQHRGCQSERR